MEFNRDGPYYTIFTPVALRSGLVTSGLVTSGLVTKGADRKTA